MFEGKKAINHRFFDYEQMLYREFYKVDILERISMEVKIKTNNIVEYYDDGKVFTIPVILSKHERKELITYLNSLSDEDRDSYIKLLILNDMAVRKLTLLDFFARNTDLENMLSFSQILTKLTDSYDTQFDDDSLGLWLNELTERRYLLEDNGMYCLNERKYSEFTEDVFVSLMKAGRTESEAMDLISTITEA